MRVLVRDARAILDRLELAQPQSEHRHSHRRNRSPGRFNLKLKFEIDQGRIFAQPIVDASHKIGTHDVGGAEDQRRAGLGRALLEGGRLGGAGRGGSRGGQVAQPAGIGVHDAARRNTPRRDSRPNSVLQRPRLCGRCGRRRNTQTSWAARVVGRRGGLVLRDGRIGCQERKDDKQDCRTLHRGDSFRETTARLRASRRFPTYEIADDHLVSDGSVVPDAAVATAPADGGTTCRDFEACGSAAEFDGSAKFARRPDFRDREIFRHRGACEIGESRQALLPIFLDDPPDGECRDEQGQQELVKREEASGRSNGKTCPFSTNWSTNADPTVAQHMMT